MFQSPGAIALQLGPFSIHWYGIIIGIGILLCYWYAIAEVRRRGIDRKPIDDMAFWVILAGIIGARLYYVIFSFEYYAAHPAEILMLWKGGLAIHGALIGGALAYFIYIRRHKIPFLLYADILMPGILLAQALGRFGNFFNNEAFGRPTDLPWKLFIPEGFRPPEYSDFSYFHPTFLYESLWNFLGFLLLFLFSRSTFRIPHSTFRGFTFFFYLAWYSFGRFFIESLRTDSLYLGSLRIAQIISVVLSIVGIIGLIFILRKYKIKSPNSLIR